MRRRRLYSDRLSQELDEVLALGIWNERNQMELERKEQERIENERLKQENSFTSSLVEEQMEAGIDGTRLCESPKRAKVVDLTNDDMEQDDIDIAIMLSLEEQKRVEELQVCCVDMDEVEKKEWELAIFRSQGDVDRSEARLKALYETNQHAIPIDIHFILELSAMHTLLKAMGFDIVDREFKKIWMLRLVCKYWRDSVELVFSGIEKVNRWVFITKRQQLLLKKESEELKIKIIKEGTKATAGQNHPTPFKHGHAYYRALSRDDLVIFSEDYHGEDSEMDSKEDFMPPLVSPSNKTRPPAFEWSDL